MRRLVSWLSFGLSFRARVGHGRDAGDFARSSSLLRRRPMLLPPLPARIAALNSIIKKMREVAGEFRQLLEPCASGPRILQQEEVAGAKPAGGLLDCFNLGHAGRARVAPHASQRARDGRAAETPAV